MDIFVELEQFVEKNGVWKLEEFCKERLESWNELEIKFAITGDSGSGKSSFINAIRGLDDDDEMSAAVDVDETTTEPCCYAHPTSPKVKFWDLPGVGTPNYPKETYWEKLELEKYDTFIIFTYCRFTENALYLAKKIRSKDKKFFFVRIKIDVDVEAEQRKASFKEESVLSEIRQNCYDNLKDLVDDKQDIFLISNYDPAKWDFARLTQAIIDVLPTRQQESLTLAIDVKSVEILKRKVKFLKRRALMVALNYSGMDRSDGFNLISSEISFYKSQLRLPKEDSHEFTQLDTDMQERIRKVCYTTDVSTVRLNDTSIPDRLLRFFERLLPLGLSIPFRYKLFSPVYNLLKQFLEELQQVALEQLSSIKNRELDNSD